MFSQRSRFLQLLDFSTMLCQVQKLFSESHQKIKNGEQGRIWNIPQAYLH